MTNETSISILSDPTDSSSVNENMQVKCNLSQQEDEDIMMMMMCAPTSPERLKVRVAQTPPTHEVTTPMSTSCFSDATTTTSSAAGAAAAAANHSPSSSSSFGDSSFSYQPSTTSSSSSSWVRVPLPSPSRNRLDRHYAKRLATSCAYYHKAAAPSTKRSNAAVIPVVTPATTTTTTIYSTTSTTVRDSAASCLLKPPEITREHDSSNLFRPTPIVTTATTSNYHSPAAAAESIQHQETRQFFFPSTPASEKSGVESFFSSSSSSAHTPSNSHGLLSSSSFRRRRHTSMNSNNNISSGLGTSDRFIPSRATSNMNVNLWDSMGSSNNNNSVFHSSSRMSDSDSNGGGGGSTSNGSTDGSNHHRTHTVASDDSNGAGGHIVGGRSNDLTPTTQQNLHNMLLRSELLGENISPYAPSVASQLNGNSRIGPNAGHHRDGTNRLRFQGTRQAFHESIFHEDMGPTSVVNSFSLTPFGTASSQRLMAAPQKRRRKIAKVPFKVLDAPALQDDFYLNLVDWSSQNVLAVGLGSCVYLWSACTSKVTKLCDLAQSDDLVTSVSWAQRGVHLAVGTNKGETQLWDTIKVKKIKTMAGHSARVGTLAWTGPILASGSRDRLIFLRDVRCNTSFTERLSAHRQEVCGLKWSSDEPAFLASGGNDNQLHVVDSRNPTQPIHRFSDHTAAVKAIAWSPHQHGLLASGGGTADRCIRFWNTLSGAALSSVDTGSQVCNLAWSQNCNEIVSTHGYSLNQIVVWRYPSLNKVVTLTGHTFRVLYLAVSPDGSTIVTGAGDETLRFWQVFPGPRSDVKNSAGGLLFPNTLGSVIR